MEGEFVSGTPVPLPPPDLDRLRQLGVPVVDDDTFCSALESQRGRRCQLAKLLVDDGWLPQAWERRMQAIRDDASSPAA